MKLVISRITSCHICTLYVTYQQIMTLLKSSTAKYESIEEQKEYDEMYQLSNQSRVNDIIV